MSPPAICCGTTPSLAKTCPAMPAMRILRPLRSWAVFISLRNQPPIWAPVLPQGMEHGLGGAVVGVGRGGEAAGAAPADLGRRLRDGGRGERCRPAGGDGAA